MPVRVSTLGWSLVVLSLAAGGRVVGQSPAAAPPFELRATSTGHEFVNRMPYPVVALLQARRGEANELTGATAVLVQAESTTEVKGLVGQVAVANLEPVRTSLPRRAGAVACAARGAVTIDPAQVEQQIRSSALEGSDAAEESIRVAWELAQLQLEQRRDEKDTFRNDPLRIHMQSRQRVIDAGTAETPAQRVDHLTRPNEALGEALEDITDLALAWASAEQAKLDVLARDAERLEAVLEQVSTAVQVKRNDLARVRMYTNAGAEFSSRAVAALDHVAAASADVPVEVLGPAAKLCAGASGEEDRVEFSIAVPRSHAVLIGEVAFDRGRKAHVVLRRVAQSERWQATLYWPIEATRATFVVRLPGRTRRLPVPGDVTTERPSMSIQLRDAEKAEGTIRKSLKDTRFRSGGGDRIKTVAVGN